jgi:glucokinase
MADYTIGVDLGGTNLRAAAVDSSGRVIEKISVSTTLEHGPDHLVREIAASIATVRRRIGADACVGIGVGAAGFMDIRNGIVLDSPNLPGLTKYPLRDRLAKETECHVILENDANAAALGEKWMGAGRDYDDLVLLTLGTGIGGGIIVGGKVLHGFVGMAAEVGHITVNASGNPCGCGNVGCLEKHASATAISAMAKMLGLGDLTSEGVYQRAMEGDDKARLVFVTMGRTLGVALANLVNIFNFPLYLLSGGVLAAWDLFAPPMMEEIARRSFVFRNTNTRVEKAVLGNEAGLYGAAYLPFQERGQSTR